MFAVVVEIWASNQQSILLGFLGTGPRKIKGRPAQTNRNKGPGRGRSKPLRRGDQTKAMTEDGVMGRVRGSRRDPWKDEYGKISRRYRRHNWKGCHLESIPPLARRRQYFNSDQLMSILMVALASSVDLLGENALLTSDLPCLRDSSLVTSPRLWPKRRHSASKGIVISEGSETTSGKRALDDGSKEKQVAQSPEPKKARIDTGASRAPPKPPVASGAGSLAPSVGTTVLYAPAQPSPSRNTWHGQQMRVMNKNNARLIQLLAAANPHPQQRHPSLMSSNLATLIAQEIVLTTSVPNEQGLGIEHQARPYVKGVPLQNLAILEPGSAFYEGKTDPMDHLDSYKSLMSLQGCSDEVMCKAFSATLKGPARSWFRKLSPGTIDSFGELSSTLCRQFHELQKLTEECFSPIHRPSKRDKKLEDFVKRFNQAILEVEDPSDKVIIMAMMEGLRPGPLFDSLSKKVLETLSALQSKTDKYIAVEELAEAKRRRRGKDDHKRKEPDTRRNDYREETRYKRPDRDPKRSNNRRPRTPPRRPEFILLPLNAPVAKHYSPASFESILERESEPENYCRPIAIPDNMELSRAQLIVHDDVALKQVRHNHGIPIRPQMHEVSALLSPHSLTSYGLGFEAVIPLEVGLPTIRIKAYYDNNNQEVLARDLDLTDEQRENALVQMASYHKQLAKKRTTRKSSTKNSLSGTSFLRKHKNLTDGTLSPN
ncbi:hypothetical protein Acr_01g0009260 [Actinidia rufa]|uniref:Retrotransposon gag domain-containing protein n=1 Tax=Actinidia rufa TaxID=165716 RepID=A0A7J0E618_9ERIC|nr:hypothetical protein Acr_01g0009260 [Actinidia rufa]